MTFQKDQQSKDGRAIAQINEQRVLKVVHDFGHIRVPELAAAVWPASSVESGEKMARRTTRRLLDAGLLLARTNAFGTTSFVLSARGAASLSARGIDARDGYDIQGVSGPTFAHRTLGTAVLAKLHGGGGTVWGEYAVNHDRAPFTIAELRQRYGKIPDGVVVGEVQQPHDATPVTYLRWIEVENTFKSNTELDRVTDLMNTFADEMDAPGAIRFAWLWIVVPTGCRHEERIVESFGRVLPKWRPEAADMVHIVRVDVVPPLRIQRIELVSLRDLAESVGRGAILPAFEY
ncbi:hypothetical protein [Denitromonas ohlonensis]|uniref:Replication-relaxation n=2 Tax=Denitromonas TaxID=139331 RepID=A0A557SF38_9RHOO|nr:hypothetical protein [Denitromonas ohlonensis]TVO64144.1 hypothetical protein FHP90_12620 [Denitromonas ohlonensis]TVO76045.1 hypothetical protein FHP89_11295 [Denitromonas ohlonensis]